MSDLGLICRCSMGCDVWNGCGVMCGVMWGDLWGEFWCDL